MKVLTRHVLLLGLIVLLALIVRLYKITNPVLDWHAFRQSDTAAVTRYYVQNGIDLLRPRYEDVSNIASRLDNLEGYRMVEFPIINGALALFIRTFPKLDLILVSRLAAILASLVTLLCMYFLSQKISGHKAGIFTAGWFALLPFAIYYSRVVLPEPFLLASLTASLLLFYYFCQNKKFLYFGLSFVTLTMAILIKPFAIFFLPVFFAIYLDQRGYKQRVVTMGLLALSFSLVPLFLWREWILQFPSGIPKSDWLFNGNNIRLHPAWWRWLFYERLTKIILGGAGLIPLLLGLYHQKRSEILIYGSWISATLLYLVVIATGNVQHDYYQVLTLPIICLLLGRGSQILISLSQKKLGNKNLSHGLMMLVFGLTLILSWQKVKGYFLINHWEYQKAGQAVDKLTARDALVIAPAYGDTQFLYQTNRRGWPIGFEIENKLNLGATIYVTTNLDDEANMLANKYFTIQQTPDYLILDLTKANPEQGTP